MEGELKSVQIEKFLAELQRSCSRLMFWWKMGGRAYVSLSSL